MDLASNLEKMFGQTRKLEKNAKGEYVYENVNVMSISEIRTMKDDEALFVYSNKKPLKLKIKPYYKDFMFNGLSKINPYKISNQKTNDNISYVDLENIEW